MRLVTRLVRLHGDVQIRGGRAPQEPVAEAAQPGDAHLLLSGIGEHPRPEDHRPVLPGLLTTELDLAVRVAGDLGDLLAGGRVQQEDLQALLRLVSVDAGVGVPVLAELHRVGADTSGRLRLGVHPRTVGVQPDVGREAAVERDQAPLAGGLRDVFLDRDRDLLAGVDRDAVRHQCVPAPATAERVGSAAGVAEGLDVVDLAIGVVDQLQRDLRGGRQPVAVAVQGCGHRELLRVRPLGAHHHLGHRVRLDGEVVVAWLGAVHGPPVGQVVPRVVDAGGETGEDEVAVRVTGRLVPGTVRATDEVDLLVRERLAGILLSVAVLVGVQDAAQAGLLGGLRRFGARRRLWGRRRFAARRRWRWRWRWRGRLGRDGRCARRVVLRERGSGRGAECQHHSSRESAELEQSAADRPLGQ